MKSETKQGFEYILNLLQDIDKVAKKDILTHFITIGGLIESSEAILSLSNKEKVIIQIYKDNLNTFKCKDSFEYSVIVKKYGRIMIVDSSFDVSNYHLLYKFFLNKKSVEIIYKKLVIEEQMQIDNIRTYYSTNNNFKDDVLRLIYELKRTSPIRFFDGLSTYTNLYSLGEKDLSSHEINIFTLLDHIKNEDFAKISDDLLIFIFVLTIIRNTGSNSRYEELNYKQISLQYLIEFLLIKIENYSIQLINKEFNISNLQNISNIIQKKYNILILKNKFFYREINGLTMTRKENILNKSQDIEYPKELINILNDYFSLYNISSDSAKESISILFDKYLYKSKNNKFNSIAEELIHTILKETINILNSDFSATRSFRDISELIKNIKLYNKTSDINHLLKFKNSNFLGYCVPSNNIIENMPSKPLIQALNTISTRMQVNGLTYFIGNFSEKVPTNLEFYFPPRYMERVSSDEYYHPGHIKYNVKTSLRSSHSLKINNIICNGLIDFRVLRLNSNQYTLKELEIGNDIASLLQMIYQALIDTVDNKDLNYKYTLGTKEWYTQLYKDQNVKN